jgi:hypothetical protein
MPWANNKVESGIFSGGSPFYQSRGTTGSVYGRVTFRKSSENLVVKRTYQKFSGILSFVGGLLSPIALGFSILQTYNKYSY